MELILANTCAAITGALDSSLGYTIRRHGDRFFSMRNPKGFVPIDGHWNFICLCAELAQKHLYLSDIRVPGWEIFQALEEAGFNTDNFNGSISTLYNAQDVLTLKERISL